MVHCAGFIVFDSTLQFTIIVTTPGGRTGFPKGKRHKAESPLECAWRELREETGLTPENVIILNPDSIYLDYKKHADAPTVTIRYYVAIAKPGYHSVLTCEDPAELESVNWRFMDQNNHLALFQGPQQRVLIQLSQDRQQLLEQALRHARQYSG